MTDLVCTPEEFLAATPMERRKYVIAQIDLTPELHEQAIWASRTSCGTAFCAAGWTVALAGEVVNVSGYIGALTGDPEVDTKRRHCGDVAAELLGLSFIDASQAWMGNNTRDDIVDLFAAAEVV